jgi:penicillin V acylase-like amidase (Ntn superfamily)
VSAKIYQKLLFLPFFLLSSQSYACSAFCLAGKDKVIVGKSYDWYFGHGHGAVYTNPRGVGRSTLIFDDSPNPASWVSKYGSIILTQFGRGTPISGMNEQGLVIEMLQLDVSKYNSSEVDKPYVNESHWSQFQLDNYASVDEVIAHVNDLRVVRAYTGIHYFVADGTGKSATIEFLDGKAVVRSGTDLPVPVLTNDPYDVLTAYDASHPGPPPNGMFSRLSEVRFQRAKQFTDQLAQTPDNRLKNMAWNIMETVRLDGMARDALMEASQWNIVYDIGARKIFFRTLKASGIKSIDLNKIDLALGAQELMVDMNLEITGDLVPHFHPYNFEANAALIRKNKWLMLASGQTSKIQPAVEYGRCATELLGEE